MGRRRKLHAAAHDGAVERAHVGDGAALDRVEDGMPFARMVDALDRRAVHVLGKIEAGGEMLAVAEDHAGLGLCAGARDAKPQRLDERVVDGVAFLRPVQTDERDGTVELIGEHVAHALGAVSCIDLRWAKRSYQAASRRLRARQSSLA